MGIEPTRAPLSELENGGFGAMAGAKCDERVNFRGMWGAWWRDPIHSGQWHVSLPWRRDVGFVGIEPTRNNAP
jgi:hypothetical protein